MNTPEELTSFLAPLAAVQHIVEHFGNQGLVIGGVAVGLLGAPRLTADVDIVLLLSIDRLNELIEVARREGLSPRIADAAAFARRHRVLLMQHAQSGIAVDISLGILPFEQEAVRRGLTHTIGPLVLRLPTAEDLIVFKAVAHRPKDMLDIEAIARNHPDLDIEYMAAHIRAFADALDAPQMWPDVEAILDRVRS